MASRDGSQAKDHDQRGGESDVSTESRGGIHAIMNEADLGLCITGCLHLEFRSGTCRDLRRCKDEEDDEVNDLDDDVREILSRDIISLAEQGECLCFTSLSFQRLIVSSLPLPCLAFHDLK